MKTRMLLPIVCLVAASACGDATRVTSLCAPTLLSPAANDTLDNGCSNRSNERRWEFVWSPCPGASSYHIYVARRGAAIPGIDWDQVNLPNYTDSNTSYVVDGNRTDWYWRVRARSRGNWGPWSVERPFEVEPLNTDCP